MYTDDFGTRKGDNCLVADFGSPGDGKAGCHTDGGRRLDTASYSIFKITIDIFGKKYYHPNSALRL